MLTRRLFIQTGAAALLIPSRAALALAGADESTRSPVLAVATDRCPNARRFIAAFGGASDLISEDPGQYLQSITRRLKRRDPSALIGLTQETDYILIAQLASENGYRTVFFGRHRHDQRHLHHVLEASGASVGRLATTLSRAGERWSEELALQAGSMLASTNTRRQFSSSSLQSRPEDSPGQLVSWSIRRLGELQ